MSNNSTSKIRVEYGGIDPACCAPYPNSCGMKKRNLLPIGMSCRPSVHPAITWFNPKLIGSPRCTLLSHYILIIRHR